MWFSELLRALLREEVHFVLGFGERIRTVTISAERRPCRNLPRDGPRSLSGSDDLPCGQRRPGGLED